jgi:hypothetical protein
MDPHAFTPLVQLAGTVVAARVLWWLVSDFVLDHFDLPHV